MACKYYIDNKVLNESEVKNYIGENYVNKEDIRLTTLGDIADILAYSNSKLILDGNEVIYTTPDNQQFKTYQEASNHVSNLAKNVKDIDLSNIELYEIDKKITTEEASNIILSDDNVREGFETQEEFDKWMSDLKIGYVYSAAYYENDMLYDTGEILIKKEDGWYKSIDISDINDSEFNLANTPFLVDKKSFIEKNKEYEQSKEIIEEWKKVNNIQYNPEEIYSRGQEFSSVVGAYSSFDVNLMMQNLLSHIEDNEKAGGKFAISAYTKPIDKQIGHLEGGGGKIKFKLYPKSEDILWASNIDVYSGSVWDASEKVNKDKKSELLGVSYTKYPSLQNVNSVQPNLADIVDNLSHHHNELAISLNFSNFEIEVDEDVPYQTKKIINSINKILEQKRNGKLVKPEIKKGQIEKYKVKSQEYFEGEVIETEQNFNTLKEAEDFIEKRKIFFGEKNMTIEITKGIQPTVTNSTLKESIESIKNKFSTNFGEKYLDTLEVKEHIDYFDDVVIQGFIINNYGNSPILDELVSKEPIFNTEKEANDRIKELFIQAEKIYDDRKNNKREYTSQALINTKIAALKEVAKKYPRSLIRSEVKPIIQARQPLSYFEDGELPFQKLNNNLEELNENLFREYNNNEEIWSISDNFEQYLNFKNNNPEGSIEDYKLFVQNNELQDRDKININCL